MAGTGFFVLALAGGILALLLIPALVWGKHGPPAARRGGR